MNIYNDRKKDQVTCKRNKSDFHQIFQQKICSTDIMIQEEIPKMEFTYKTCVLSLHI